MGETSAGCIPKDWIASFGEIAKFAGRILGEVYSLRVLRFFGEALRQCGDPDLSSTIVIWGLVFIIGLQCGIEGAYFTRSAARPRTRASSPPGATCASSSPTPSAT